MLHNAADYWDEVEEFFKTGVWEFKDSGTVIQCDRVDGKNIWYLAYSDDGTDPHYWLPIEKNHKSIMEAILHLSEKPWVNMDDVFTAMLPAIRAVVWNS